MRPLAVRLLRGLLPLMLALLASAAVLLALNIDPLGYLTVVVDRGLLSPVGLQQTLTRAAPQLALAAALIIAFRAGIWNLGLDGQFILGAVTAGAVAPMLVTVLPWVLALALTMVLAAGVGALWGLVPALLRAVHGVNEIVTSLMMTFLGLSLANLMIKLVLWDPATTVPQTRTLAVDDRLPRLFGTTVSSGLVLSLALIVLVHLVMTRTAYGDRLEALGLNPRAAAHAGLGVRRLTVGAFVVSAALAGLAGAVEVLGVAGTVRADWNPAYGLLVVPAVLLARLDGVWAIVGVVFLAALQIGGESAARRTGVATDFILVTVALLLVALAAVARPTAPGPRP